eukprot:CAMPEP_0194030182 /NCGR_PEP_ID=MMETSP0009_2-20130614/3755_1 /TAXON_ID=210454 /ORGANISM="Grammatophora oceanica, Strain CCMP 410" /LENGTH=335 /DNA_ID=CAMNT_0038670085 /DNA_START=219 /DNA_END=1226 /DNA_ORIENTATION=+
MSPKRDDTFGDSSDFENNDYGAFGDFSAPSPTPMLHEKFQRRSSCGGRVEYQHPSMNQNSSVDPFSEARPLTPPPREYSEKQLFILEGDNNNNNNVKKKKLSRRKSNDDGRSTKYTPEEEAERAERKQRKKERKAEKARRRRSNESGDGELDYSTRTSKSERPRRRKSNDGHLSKSMHDKPRRRRSNEYDSGDRGHYREKPHHRVARRSSCGPGASFTYTTNLDPPPNQVDTVPTVVAPRVQRRLSCGPGAHPGDPPRKQQSLESMLARQDSVSTVKTEAMSVFSEETTASGRRRRVPRRMSAPHSYTDPDTTEITNHMAVATVGIISEARGLRW